VVPAAGGVSALWTGKQLAVVLLLLGACAPDPAAAPALAARTAASPYVLATVLPQLVADLPGAAALAEAAAVADADAVAAVAADGAGVGVDTGVDRRPAPLRARALRASWAAAALLVALTAAHGQAALSAAAAALAADADAALNSEPVPAAADGATAAAASPGVIAGAGASAGAWVADTAALRRAAALQPLLAPVSNAALQPRFAAAVASGLRLLLSPSASSAVVAVCAESEGVGGPGAADMALLRRAALACATVFCAVGGPDARDGLGRPRGSDGSVITLGAARAAAASASESALASASASASATAAAPARMQRPRSAAAQARSLLERILLLLPPAQAQARTAEAALGNDNCDGDDDAAAAVLAAVLGSPANLRLVSRAASKAPSSAAAGAATAAGNPAAAVTACACAWLTRLSAPTPSHGSAASRSVSGMASLLLSAAQLPPAVSALMETLLLRRGLPRTFAAAKLAADAAAAAAAAKTPSGGVAVAVAEALAQLNASADVAAESATAGATAVDGPGEGSAAAPPYWFIKP
jgi:hypothetical protein